MRYFLLAYLTSLTLIATTDTGSGVFVRYLIACTLSVTHVISDDSAMSLLTWHS